VFGLLFFEHFATEDVYSNLIFSDTISKSGYIFNEFARMEARVGDSPPLLALISSILNSISPIGNENWFKILPYIFQAFSVAIVYAIGMNLFQDRFLPFFMSFLFIFGSYNVLWVTSFSPVDALLVLLLTGSTFFFVKFWRTRKTAHLILCFASCGCLSLAHNFGNVFVAMLIVGYIFVSLVVEKKPRYLISKKNFFLILLGISFWFIFGGALTFFKAVAIYLPGVSYSFTNEPVFLGTEYLALLPSFFQISLLLTTILGSLLAIYYRKIYPVILFFMIWLVLNLIILMIIPASYSHRSRYHLQFFPAIILLSSFFVYILFIRFEKIRFQSRKYLRFLFIIILIVLLVLPIINYAPNYANFKRWVSESYGLRSVAGEFTKEAIGQESILYIYWPSFVHSYSLVPSSNLYDFSVMIQNSENVAERCYEIDAKYFIYDKLSGYYYPFPDKGVELLKAPFINLTIFKFFNSKLIIYYIQFYNGIQWINIPAENDELVYLGFSDMKLYNISEDAHGIVKKQSIAYYESTSKFCSIKLRSVNPDNLSFISVYLKLKLSPSANITMSLRNEENVLDSVRITGTHLKGWEWWFEYYRLDFSKVLRGEFEITFEIQNGSLWFGGLEIVGKHLGM
jgi:hypothetical protein